MNKLYSRIVWENFPSEKTALNESNLNRMDLAIDNIDNRVIEMDSTKVNVETANTLIRNWTIDEETGVITVEKLNGEKIIFDLNIEKIPVNFELSEDGILTMTTDDGTQYTANIGAMIPILTFEDSDEIAVSVSSTGVNKTYSFSIKAGSVTEDKLQPNFLADVKTEAAKAQASQTAAAQSASAASGSATLAESYTHGGTGAREGEDADNARYYMEQAKAVSVVNVATTETAGIVKPDGVTITVDPDGTIHGQSKVDEMTGATAEANGTSGTVPAPKAGQENHVLKGNGAWEALAYDSELSAESENAPQTKVVDAKTKEIEKNLSHLSNPNLLINPDFKINQRRNSGYTYGGSYTFDRWLARFALQDCSYVESEQAVHIHGDVNEGFEQLIEDYKSLEGKTVTLSMCYKSTGLVGFYIMNTTDSVDSWVTFRNPDITDTYQTVSITGTVKSNITRLICGVSLGDSDLYIKWFKLELGSVATPFVPPDPASELVKCQRYYKKYLRLPVLRNIQGLDYFGISTPDVFRVSPDIDGGGSTYIASALGEPDFEINIIERNGTGGTNGAMQWFKIVKSDGSSIDQRITSMEIHNIAFDAEIR